MSHCYPLIRECAGRVPTGIAVQDGNYAHRNPKTGQPVTIPELVEFATEYLKVDYIYWCTEEPFYSQKLMPYLRTQNRGQEVKQVRAAACLKTRPRLDTIPVDCRERI